MPAGFSIGSSSGLPRGVSPRGRRAAVSGLLRWAVILLVAAALGAAGAGAWLYVTRVPRATPPRGRTVAQGALEGVAVPERGAAGVPPAGDIGLRGVMEAAAERRRRKRLILLSDGGGRYNTGVWSGWGESPAVLNWAAAGVRVDKRCPVECEFSRDMGRVAEADCVVIEAINHPKFGLGADVPFAWPAPTRDNPRAAPGAAPAPTAIPARLPLNALFYYEAARSYPGYTLAAPPDFLAGFDITMTPSARSLLPVTMTCPWGRTPGHFVRPPPPKVPGRTLAYFNEHGVAPAYAPLVDALFAAAGDRLDAYVHRSNKPMPAEAGGNPYALSTRLDYLGTYRFVLVTEAIEEEDWIEPDLSQVFLAGAVPVYIGAPNVEAYVPGPRSFVHMRDFASAEALWAYLASFDDSPEGEARYRAEFFAWKERAAMTYMMDEQGQDHPVGTGFGVMHSAILPQAALRKQLTVWAPRPAGGDGAVPSLEELRRAHADEAVGFEKTAEAAWRSFRRRLDHCVCVPRRRAAASRRRGGGESCPGAPSRRRHAETHPLPHPDALSLLPLPPPPPLFAGTTRNVASANSPRFSPLRNTVCFFFSLSPFIE